MPELSWEFALAIFGIAITIYFGVRTVGRVRKNRHRQAQTASEDSVAIQSGRDTKINGR